MDDILSFFGLIVLLVVLILVFGVTYGFHYAFILLDEKLGISTEGITTYGNIYYNDYFDLDGNRLNIKYFKRIDGYAVEYFIANKDSNNELRRMFSDSSMLFLQEKKFVYKTNIDNRDIHLILDDKGGEEVVMIDNHKMIYFNKTPLIKKTNIVESEPFDDSKYDNAEEY